MAHSHLAMGFGGGLSPPPLPTPYAEEIAPGNTTLERVEEMLEKAEVQRLYWGQLFTWWPMRIWRNGFGILIAIFSMSAVLLPDYTPRSTIFVLIIWSTLLIIALGPAIGASEWALHGAALHNQHAKRRGRNLQAQPGSDRILDSLNDVRRNNLVHLVMGLSALMLIAFSTLTPLMSVAWNLSLMLAMIAGVSMALHIQFTSESLDYLEDEEPFLTLHAPTHYPTQIHSTLSEVVATHLDPLLRMRWDAWRKRLAESLRTQISEGEALERLLYSVHLSQQGLIPKKGLKSELCELYQDEIIDWMESEQAPITLGLIHRLVAHAKAWQPSFFNLVDRLQMDILDNGAAIVNGAWRMDAECEYICKDGQGSLFILLHNQTEVMKRARIDVFLTGGSPDSYMFSVEVPPCPPPQTPLPLIDASGGDDAVKWMAQYLDRTVVLWLKVTWLPNESGLRQLSVSLKNQEGEVELSNILHTTVQKRIGAGDRGRRSRLRLARRLVNKSQGLNLR